MSAWIVITAADLKVGKAAALVDAAASAALGAGQADPTPEVIGNVSKRIRDEIQSSGKYQVSATANAIPPSLKSLAVRLINWDLRSRLNVRGNLEPTPQDYKDHTSDERYLERIAEGKVPIDVPADPLGTPEVQRGGLIEQAQAGNSGNSREDLNRL